MPSSQTVPVAIIGLSCIFPQAHSLDSYWERILAETDCITEVPVSRWRLDDYYDPDPKAPDKTYCRRGGFIPDIDFNPLEFGLPPNILEITDVSQLLSLVTAKDALNDAGYIDAPEGIRQRTGVVLGVGGGQKLITPLTSRLQYPIWERVLRQSGISEAKIQSIIQTLKLAYAPWEENSFPGMLGNVIAGRIANRFDLGGINCVVDAACASSLAAVRMAVSELVEGRSDMMITGGVDTDNSIFMYMCFSKTPAFSKQQMIRPFDAESDGMLIGEGIGMLVLKRLEDAERDGDRIYAVIRGMGTSSDGKYKSIYAPRSSGQAIALRRAYTDAGFSPATVGLIEAHGTGTEAGDPAEFSALSEVFSEGSEQLQHIALGSVKSQIGHTKSAAGAASLIKVVLSLYHQILPATINVTQPNPKLKLEQSPFYLNTQTRPWIKSVNGIPRRAGVSSFGFGGTNYHVVLEEYGSGISPISRLHSSPSAILLSAPSPTQLMIQCESVLTQLLSDTGKQVYAELIQQHCLIPVTSARLGFVVSSLADACDRLQTAIHTLKQQLSAAAWTHPHGIYYRQTGIEPQGKVVALFPGQGAQSLHMGKALALNFPEIRQAYAQMDQLLVAEGRMPISQRVFPIPAFSPEQQLAQAQALQRTENTQPAIGAFSAGLYEILRKAGFQPDFAIGHSFGELTALWAAGALTQVDYFVLVNARGRAMAAPAITSVDMGAMLAVSGDLSQLEITLQSFSGVTIANWNSQNQVVVAGATQEITRLQPVLEQQGFSVVLLPVSAAFHTPFVAHAQQTFAQAIRSVQWQVPQIPVYANATAAPYPKEPDAIAHLLAAQMLNPVRFKDQIEAIYASGGRIFVEVGPRNILTNLVQTILADRPHIAIAMNPSRQQDSDLRFREAVLQLQVVGLPLGMIDPYCRKTSSLPSPSRKGFTVQLNGNNYVSEATKLTFEQALQTSHSSSTSPQPDSLSMSVPQSQSIAQTPPFAANMPVQGSQVNVAFSQPSISDSPSSKASMSQYQPGSDSFERLMMRFYEHQSDLLKVHKQYLHDQQVMTDNVLQLMMQHYSGRPAEETKLLMVEPISHSLSNGAAAKPEQSGQPAEITTPSNHLPIVTQPMIPTLSPPPPEMPSPKLIEVANQVNVNADEIERSLVLDRAVEQPVSTQTQPTPVSATIDIATLSNSMLTIVSDKTGYPVEMLELGMDMEAELGIDSIKRVEILGAMQENFPNLPPVNPEVLAELRTLQQIVDYMGQQAIALEKKNNLCLRDLLATQLPPAIQRGIAKLYPLPLPDVLECSWNEQLCCLISDDGTSVTGDLVHSLLKRGWKVIVLSFPETLVSQFTQLPNGVERIILSELCETHLQQHLQRIQQKFGLIGAFIHLHPVWTTAVIARMLLKQIFLITKQLKKLLQQAAQHGRSWFVTVVRLDGELGSSQRILFNPIDSGLLGLTKTMNLECPAVFCRSLDISPEIPSQQVAQMIVAELFDPNRLVVDVSYGLQGRQTMVCQPEPIWTTQTDNRFCITPNSVFLVSGGGRGITAKCVVRMAQAFQCQFILLGRSALTPEPRYTQGYDDERELKRRIIDELVRQGEQPTPTQIQSCLKAVLQGREIRATLAEIESVGGRAVYVSTDIQNDLELREKVARAEQSLGKISSIIHGAGHLADKLIEYKTEQDFESVYAPKVDGLNTLLSCVDKTQLKHLVLFASAAGFYGNIGQSDYAIANEILNRVAYQFKQQHPNCQVSAFNWGPWDGGMVTPELKQLFKQRGIEVIPVDVGTQMLVNELTWGNPQTVQILVGSPLVALSDNLMIPLTTYQIQCKLTLDANPLLHDHVIGDHAVLPTVFASAWMANTCEQLFPGYHFFQCQNLKVLKGIVFDASLADKYKVEITEVNKSSPAGEVDLQVLIWSEAAISKPRYHYSTQIQLRREIPESPIYSEFDQTVDISLVNISPYQDQTLFHGINFQGITRILNLTSRGLTMECVLPQIQDQEWGQITPQAFNPLAADIQFQSMLIWVRRTYQAASLPLRCRLGEHFRTIPIHQTFYVSMLVQSSNSTQLTADIISHDSDGKIYSRVLGAEVTISKQLNPLFAGTKASIARNKEAGVQL